MKLSWKVPALVALAPGDDRLCAVDGKRLYVFMR